MVNREALLIRLQWSQFVKIRCEIRELKLTRVLSPTMTACPPSLRGGTASRAVVPMEYMTVAHLLPTTPESMLRWTRLKLSSIFVIRRKANLCVGQKSMFVRMVFKPLST